jgi:glycosyltransferase involved in cell wall biosynthesis
MRIGIDATALPSKPVGAGNYIIQLIRGLARLETGCELVVFTYPHGRGLIGLPETSGLRWVLLTERSPAQRLIWEQVAFPGLVQRAQIDLLHSPHYTRPVSLPCASVVTFHDMTFFLYPQLHTWARRVFFPLMIRLSARLADVILAVSESTRQDAIRLLGLSPERISVTPLGVSEQYRPMAQPDLLEAVRRRYRLPERFILYVGLVEPRKNLPGLIRAYHSLSASGNLPFLVIVGQFGWRHTEVIRLVEQLGLHESVLFAGYVAPADLPMVYNLAEVFVYPSTYEGFGLPPLEAMACGTPVITTAVSAMPEHVGDAGVLVPPGDDHELAQALQRVLEDPHLRQELASKGPLRAAQFTWERTSRATLQVYRQVLASR